MLLQPAPAGSTSTARSWRIGAWVVGRRAVGVTGGLVLALGMGALLLVWLDREEGASGLVFMAGVLAGIVIVAVTALMPGD